MLDRRSQAVNSGELVREAGQEAVWSPFVDVFEVKKMLSGCSTAKRRTVLTRAFTTIKAACFQDIVSRRLMNELRLMAMILRLYNRDSINFHRRTLPCIMTLWPSG